jgi:hypothetical protein
LEKCGSAVAKQKLSAFNYPRPCTNLRDLAFTKSLKKNPYSKLSILIASYSRQKEFKREKKKKITSLK